MTNFSDLGLSANLVRAVTEKGYTNPTPVQCKAIPVILGGRDVFAGAQTGTGKTAGFTLPLLQRLSAENIDAKRRKIRALILTPTRELAAQVEDSVRTYAKFSDIKSTAIFGGVNINGQIAKLRQGVDILVATPGRLLDHAGQKTIDLSNVQILVLDEADRMLDMGFIGDIRKILQLVPKNVSGARQTLLFSATYSSDIQKLANTLLYQPEHIEVASRNSTVDTVSQLIHPVDRERKAELLSWLIGSKNWRQVLVFTRTKHGANRLASYLVSDGLSAAAIHGNKSQGARTKALNEFKSGAVRVLVATDIAARGLDINQLPHVVNYELPNVAEDYVHRIGRTGRAGNSGEAVSLVCGDEMEFLRNIERLINKRLKTEVVEGYQPTQTAKAKAASKSREHKGKQSREANSAKPRSSTSDQPKHKTLVGKHAHDKSAAHEKHKQKPKRINSGEKGVDETSAQSERVNHWPKRVMGEQKKTHDKSADNGGRRQKSNNPNGDQKNAYDKSSAAEKYKYRSKKTNVGQKSMHEKSADSAGRKHKSKNINSGQKNTAHGSAETERRKHKDSNNGEFRANSNKSKNANANRRGNNKSDKATRRSNRAVA